MKTILILTHVQLDNSPYCSFVHNHAKALVNEGYKVIVLTPTTIKFSKKYWKSVEGKTSGVKMIDGVEVHYFKRIGFSNLLYKSKINLNGISYYWFAKRKIKKIVKENDIYFIDAHMFKTEGYVARKLKKKYKIPTVLTLHGTSFFKNLTFDNGINDIKKIAKVIDSFAVVSSKFAKKLNNLDINNYKIIYNGINYYTDVENKNNNNHNIISVGTLIKRKNFDVTIKAFNIVRKKYKDARLTIIGDGPELNNLKKLVDELKITNFVSFKGRLDNNEVYNNFANSSIFILPSVDEGFGIVYPEAMFNGCIPIGTIGEGIDGFIENAYNGFLTAPNYKDIANLVIDIFNNKYNVANIRKNAIETSKQLSWKKNAQQYIEMIGDLK